MLDDHHTIEIEFFFSFTFFRRNILNKYEKKLISRSMLRERNEMV